MAGKQINIPLKGLVRNTAGTTCADGELDEVVNLRHKDGSFRPICEREVLLRDVAYEPIYVHSNAGYKHFLGVSGGKLYYFAIETNGVVEYLPIVQELISVGADVSFTQTGNVINALDENGFQYCIWYENEYRMLNTEFDGSATSTSLLPEGRVDFRVSELDSVRVYRSDGEVPYVDVDGYKGLLQKSEAIERKDGRLGGFFLVCTAIELYDGTCILHSKPALLCQPHDTISRKEQISYPSGNTYSYMDYPVYYPNINDETPILKENSSSNYIEYLTAQGIPSQITQGHDSMYEEGYPEEYNIAEMDQYEAITMFHEQFNNAHHNILRCANKLEVKLEKNILASYEPLIKSLSVYMTEQVSMYKYDEILDFGRKKYVFGVVGGAVAIGTSYNYYAEKKTNAKIKEELSSLQNFYKVFEIPFADLQSGKYKDKWTTIDLSGKLDILTSLEALPLDNMSRVKQIPKYQFTYNGRLHIANYESRLSRGFPIDYFFANQGRGQFNANEVNSVMTPTFFEVVTEIKTITGVNNVVRYIPLNDLPYTWWADLNGIVSYPDQRAIRMTFRIKSDLNGGTVLVYENSFDLEAHPTHNYAYYISDDLKPISFGNPATLYNHTIAPTPEVSQNDVTSNGLKVSEVSNPFVFPVEYTYMVGNGTIRALSTNTIALSTGQFGEFPLYVFCSDGIWGLFVGQNGITYTAIKPVSREVCNNAMSVKPIDSGVVFSTEKGVLVIAGSQIEEISTGIEGKIFDFTNDASNDYLRMFGLATSHDKLVQMQADVSKEDVLEFMKGAIVGYNYTDREVWFTRDDKTYSYVFSRGVWYKVRASGSSFVGDYPRQYLLKDGTLTDISTSDGLAQETMFLTRPLKFGIQGFKQLLRVVLRGNIHTSGAEKYAGIYVFGSKDGYKWVFLGGNEQTGTLRDIGTRVERIDCKYFRIGFVGALLPDSTLDYIEVEAQEKIGGKIR